MLDIAAVVTPIGLFFGRIANFINGELWGRAGARLSLMPWCFPHAGPVPRHPSQLYEAFGEGLVLFVVMAFAVRRFGFRRPGLLGGIFVLGYAVARIVCEFFREPDAQLGFLFGSSVEALGGGITMGMLLSIPMALVGARRHRGWPRAALYAAAHGRSRRRVTPLADSLARAHRPRRADHGRALHGLCLQALLRDARSRSARPAISPRRPRSARCSAS